MIQVFMQPRDHRSLTFQQLAFGFSFMQSRNICHGPKAALKPHTSFNFQFLVFIKRRLPWNGIVSPQVADSWELTKHNRPVNDLYLKYIMFVKPPFLLIMPNKCYEKGKNTVCFKKSNPHNLPQLHSSQLKKRR